MSEKERILELTEALAQAVEESQVLAELKKTHQEVEKHEAAKTMLRNFRQKQMEVEQRAMAQGGQPGEEDIKDLQNYFQLISNNPYVRDFLLAEQRFLEIWSQVHQRLAVAVGAKQNQ